MAESRRIIIMEGDKKVYEGPEQRHSHSVAYVPPPKFLGVTLRDFLQLIGILIAVVMFYVRTDDTIKELVKTNIYLSKFATNSDLYHSATTGWEFEQGRPTGRQMPQYGGKTQFNKTRDFISTTAHAGEE